MKLQMIGCSHHHTPIDIRERLAFDDGQSAAFLTQLLDEHTALEAVLVSTCNRVELYCASDDDASVPDSAKLIHQIAEFHHLRSDQIESHMQRFETKQAISHLFSVTSSLDSLVVGETQILGQVKNAYELARSQQFAGPILHAAFQQASYVARRVANETEIQKRRLSVPSVAVSEIAANFFERLDDKRILVIGVGEMGQETMRYLADAGASDLTIVNRSLDTAKEIGVQFGAKVAAWDALGEAIETADLVVSTTSASEPILSVERFKQIMQARTKGTLLMLDLAVPRDFDAAIGKLPDVYLYTLDDLQSVCDRNVEFRKRQWPRAQRIVTDEVERFFSNAEHRNAGPMIQQLRAHANAIKQSELQRLKNKLSNQGINGSVETEISQSFDRLVNKLLHPPLQSLREENEVEQRASLVAALKRLFQLKD